MMTDSTSQARRSHKKSRLGLQLWDGLRTVLVNLLVVFLVIVYLFPISYMVLTALKMDSQFSDIKSPIWPARIVTYTYEGEDYPLYKVPIEGNIKKWALVEKHRQDSAFVDPANPEAGPIIWEGRWLTLAPVYEFSPTFENFTYLWEYIDYPKLVWNTVKVTTLSGIGVMISSILVAYGFSRFRIPGGNLLFILLIATILIPEKVTLIPIYYIFARILNWNGTYYPLIVPHLFGNAVLIFLLRQNFKSIPREMEEAAMIDGAGPLRILLAAILPQSGPAITTAALLHFFYAWNELRQASLYLGIVPDLHTLAFRVQQYQSYVSSPNRQQVSALFAMAIPVLVLFLSQREFMHEVLVTGLEK
jgi:multiple sugar transport system permease protein